VTTSHNAEPATEPERPQQYIVTPYQDYG